MHRTNYALLVELAASEFYPGVYSTALEPGEILISISIPVPARGHGYATGSSERNAWAQPRIVFGAMQR